MDNINLVLYLNYNSIKPFFQLQPCFIFIMFLVFIKRSTILLKLNTSIDPHSEYCAINTNLIINHHNKPKIILLTLMLHITKTYIKFVINSRTLKIKPYTTQS